MSQTSPDGRALLGRALRTLDELQARLDAVERPLREPIAVIGLGCRFPRGANDPDGFWRNLREGVDGITEVPRERWDVDEIYDPEPGKPGKVYTRHGGFLDRVYEFDPHFFGIAPREALSMDPQQRLLLEVCWEALERSGQAANRLAGSATGVFIGIGASDYSQLQTRSGDLACIDAYFGAGASHSIASGRVSYALGLQGPCVSVDTACSSSLVALHLAVQSLRLAECRMALAGGVSLMLAPEGTLATCQARMLSPDSRCKTFDASADGYGRAEGCGIVVLKRISDALADEDRILALIRGTAINQDGRSSGITAPNGPAQEAVIREALVRAGVSPLEIGYLETHGTGTSLGDPIEVRALAAVLGAGRPVERPLLIGSVKTNIGHLEAGAGIAGFIKMVLALEHEEIPPHLHFTTPNPHVPWAELPVRVATDRTPWPRGDVPRLAGVSSFGFSGTNCHVVLEEAPAPKPAPTSLDRPRHVLALSAKTEEALRELAGRYTNHLESHPDESWPDVCHTANAGRAPFAHRAVLPAASSAEARPMLEALVAGTDAPGLLRGLRSDRRPQVAFLFTGQGSQYWGMGRELYETQPTFKGAMDRCAEVLAPRLGKPLLEVMFGGEGSVLDETAYTQPALFALEWSVTELWRSWGVEPSVVLGHSVGEYVAACVAGVVSLEDGLKLIAERARLMQGLARDGAMVSLVASEERVREAIAPHAGEVSVAAVNGPESVVISGRREAVRRVVEGLERSGVKAKELAVSHAFHSPLMEPMLDEFEGVAAGIRYEAPRLGVVSNVTGRLLKGGEIDGRYWRRHVREGVQFFGGMKALREQGCEVFVEVGPSPVLLGMGRGCVAEGYGVWLPTLRKGRGEWEQVLSSLGELYVRGVEVDWAGFDRDYPRRKVVLPTYPFQRERY
ncbi:MAG TPA: type I polyketide synthase, partial [Vicinamibacteria bacterium]|nr:type I polyketide synthase [Vicinamibacteria bacterium]